MFNNTHSCCIISIKKDTEEIRDLCRTLDLDIYQEIFQRRNRPDPNTFIGSGKLESLKELSGKVDIFVFDGQLNPSQHFRLETIIKKPCTDRIGIVLEIFNRHAGSREAQAQVALARIRYELPFLREWINKSLSDDRPGFLAGGEYAIDTYYENARRQMKRIEAILKKITKEREIRRRRRRERGFYLISICGYTNSGKSSLLNALSGNMIQVDDKMFSTLSITTRRLSKERRKILLTDTVGFIRNLPPDLIDAFDATMEEIYGSDCILLLLDISDDSDNLLEKFSTSMKILMPRIDTSRMIIVLNKADLITDESLAEKIKLIKEHLHEPKFYLISAKKEEGLETLIDGILHKIGIAKKIEISLPLDDNGKKIYHWLSDRFVISYSDWSYKIHIKLDLTDEELEIVKQKLANVGNKDYTIRPADSSGNKGVPLTS